MKSQYTNKYKCLRSHIDFLNNECDGCKHRDYHDLDHTCETEFNGTGCTCLTDEEYDRRY